MDDFFGEDGTNIWEELKVDLDRVFTQKNNNFDVLPDLGHTAFRNEGNHDFWHEFDHLDQPDFGFNTGVAFVGGACQLEESGRGTPLFGHPPTPERILPPFFLPLGFRPEKVDFDNQDEKKQSQKAAARLEKLARKLNEKSRELPRPTKKNKKTPPKEKPTISAKKPPPTTQEDEVFGKFDEVNAYALSLWDRITPCDAMNAQFGLAIHQPLLKVRFAHRTNKYAGLSYIRGLDKIFVTSHLPENILHIYAQVMYDIDWKANQNHALTNKSAKFHAKPRVNTDANGITTAMRIHIGQGKAPVAFKDLPKSMRGIKVNSKCDPLQLMRELLEFESSAMFHDLERQTILPAEVRRELRNLDIVPADGKFGMMAINQRRVFRKNPKCGQDWYEHMHMHMHILFFPFLVQYKLYCR